MTYHLLTRKEWFRIDHTLDAWTMLAQLQIQELRKPSDEQVASLSAIERQDMIALYEEEIVELSAIRVKLRNIWLPSH